MVGDFFKKGKEKKNIKKINIDWQDKVFSLIDTKKKNKNNNIKKFQTKEDKEV